MEILQALLEMLRRKGILEWPTETRCDTCSEAASCPAFDTAVIYPCPYYHQEEA